MELFEADLQAFRDDWMLQGHEECTVEVYINWLRKYRAWCEPQGLDTSTVRAAKAFLVDITRRKPWDGYMASRAIKALGRFLAVDEGNPRARRGRPQPGDRFMTLDFVSQPKDKPQRTADITQIDKLLLVCGSDLRGLRDVAIIQVLGSTGMRRSELSRMLWSHLDTTTRNVVIPKAKNGQRIVRLSKEAIAAIRRYRRALDEWELDNHRESMDECWVSISRYTPLSSNGIQQMLVLRSREAGIPTVTAHSFRRFFATDWLRRGGSETALRHMAGWQSPSMVEKYTKTVEAEQALREHQRLFG